MRVEAGAFFFVTAVALGCASRAQAGEGPPDEAHPHSLVCLTAREPDTTIPNFGGKLLVREILRQAVLIAARDQLRVSTRDMALRETMPSEGELRESLFDIQTAECLGAFVRLRLRHGTDDGAPLVFEKQIPISLINRRVVDYSGLVIEAERLSRRELVDALCQAGIQEQHEDRGPAIELDADIDKRLGEMNYFSQIAVLRDLDAMHRERAESPQRLGALVRAYAHLGQLCRFHWNASSKVFHARALLYAQRLIVADHQSAWSLRHRAYARAFAGLHGAALADLETAGKVATKAAETQTMKDQVPWELLIDALCRYDYKTAQKLSVGDMDQLGTMIAFLGVERSGCAPLVLAAAERAFEVIPECFWICDSMDALGGVSLKHLTTVRGPTVLQNCLAGRLAAMPHLPENVGAFLEKQALEKPKEGVDPAWAAGSGRPIVEKMLVKAGSPTSDEGEPSWEVLGRLVEDVSFVHVYRRFAFFHEDLALPRDSYQEQIALSEAVIGDHPYAEVLKCARVDAQYHVEAIQDLFAKVEIRDADLSSGPLASMSWLGPPGTESIGQRLWATIQRHADDVAHDLILLSYANRTPGVTYYGRFQEVSPRSPLGAALVITELDDLDPKRYETIEKDFGYYPLVLWSIGLRYVEFRQYAEAERVLKRYVEQWPDIKGNELLAQVYWKQEKYDQWKDALDETLKQEDVGLAHAKVRVDIARFLLEHDRLQEAIPYADDAASTGAEWAMECAADVNEAAGKLDRAEEFMRATSTRYMAARYKWYFWCCKTGHGDVESARALAEAEVEALESSTIPADLDLLGDIYLLLDKKDLARRAYQSALEAGGADYVLSGIHAIILADEAGHNDARDVYLDVVVQRIPRNFSTRLGFVLWLKNAYSQPAGAEPDEAALEKLLAQEFVDDVERLILDYYAARHFYRRGHADLARRHAERSLQAKYPARENTAYAMAGALLRRLNADKIK